MSNEQPGLTLLGKLFIAAVVSLCGYGAYYYLAGPGAKSSAPSAGTIASGPASASDPVAPGDGVTVGIAYGTEKQRWLQWAVEQFAQAPKGRGVHVQLIPMGSLEAAQALVNGDTRIQVWSPASALYKETFVAEWTLKYGKAPILREDALALTPMVFVMWDERYQAFTKKYPTVSFQTIGQAMAEKSGWTGIAGHSEWGLFKFGHTHPNQSNSGLMTLVLMAFDYHKKCGGLELKDVLSDTFQEWMRTTERGTSGLSNSTGNLMRDMVLRGPSSYDAVFVYESVAVDFLKNAEGRWGPLRIVYPDLNMWNDNPYYVLEASWSSEAQRKAAGDFLDFLMSERVQREALVHGFRPGNPAVSIKSPQSPFVQSSASGLRVALTTSCEAPSATVIANLLGSWQRGVGR